MKTEKSIFDSPRMSERENSVYTPTTTLIDEAQLHPEPISSGGLFGACKRFSLTSSCAVLFDVISITFGTVLGVLLYDYLLNRNFRLSTYAVIAFVSEYSVAFVLLARSHYLYGKSHNLLWLRQTAETLRVSTLSFVIVAISIYLGKIVVPRRMLLLCWVLSTFFLLVTRHQKRTMIAHFRASVSNQRRVLIYGSGPDARRLYSLLLKSPDLGLNPIAFLDEGGPQKITVIYSHDYRHKNGAPVLYQPLTSQILSQLHVDELYFTGVTPSTPGIAQLMAIASSGKVSVSFVGAPQTVVHDRPPSIQNIDGLLVTSYARDESQAAPYSVAKRIFDLCVAVTALLATSPIWLFVALWIKRTSSGPIFFKQWRIGQNGKGFNIYKFRSMYVDAPKYGRSPEKSHDPRITPAGRFLRRSSLDELPQLINVLRGEMSIVGPRPEMPYVVEKYSEIERQRLCVPQGITGCWQLSADREYEIHKNIEYDLYYIQNRGFFLDIAILLHTVMFAAKGI